MYNKVPKRLQNNLLKLKSERQQQIIDLNACLKKGISDVDKERIYVELNWLNDEIGLIDYVMLFGTKILE